MTRDDLKEGMIIEERDGNKYFIREFGIVSTFDKPTGIYTYVSDYNYDLTYICSSGSDWGDIIRVYDKDMNLLWDREQGNIDIDIMFENTIKKYRVNPIEFMKDYLGIELTSYQEMMLKKILNESEE